MVLLEVGTGTKERREEGRERLRNHRIIIEPEKLKYKNWLRKQYSIMHRVVQLLVFNLINLINKKVKLCLIAFI